MCVDDLCSCVRRGFLVIKKIYSLVHSLGELNGSTAECADQNCGFCRKLNKTQLCGRNPYTRGEPRYILCRGGSVVWFCSVYASVK